MTFRKIEGDTAIVSSGGVYRQCDLYDWDGKLFAKAGGGFVRLKSNGSTSKDGLNIVHVMTDNPLLVDRFGRLCVTPGDGRKVLESAASEKLLIGSEQ